MAGAGRGGKTAPLRHQEAIGGDTESGVVVKAAPAAPFEVPQAEFLFQFLVIAFDDPALFGQSGQISQADVGGQVREPVFARFSLVARPLDQQPLRLSRLWQFVIPMGRADAHSGEAGTQRTPCAFPPGDGFPGSCRQTQRQLLRRYGWVLRMAAQPASRSTASRV